MGLATVTFYLFPYFRPGTFYCDPETWPFASSKRKKQPSAQGFARCELKEKLGHSYFCSTYRILQRLVVRLVYESSVIAGKSPNGRRNRGISFLAGAQLYLPPPGPLYSYTPSPRYISSFLNNMSGTPYIDASIIPFWFSFVACCLLQGWMYVSSYC